MVGVALTCVQYFHSDWSCRFVTRLLPVLITASGYLEFHLRETPGVSRSFVRGAVGARLRALVVVGDFTYLKFFVAVVYFFHFF